MVGRAQDKTLLARGLRGLVRRTGSIARRQNRLTRSRDDLTNIGTLFAFILVCIGIMILRVKQPDRERPFRVPFGTYVVPGLGILSCVGLIYYLPPSSWMRFLMWLVVGGLVYFFYGFSHSRLRGRKTN